jgi:predicted AlkP superfamily pyrophosphatase or phosphodiesterase
VAQGLRVSNPSTTWPNHTTLVTGVSPDKHGVLLNGLLTRGGPGEPIRIEGDRDKQDMVAVPTLYDQLHRAGFRTAGINWPCTRGAAALDDNFPDAPDRVRAMTPRLRAELIRAGLLTDATDASFLKKGPAGAGQAWNAAALHLLKARPPHLLLLHLLDTDVIQHRYGPQSLAAYAALALADAQLADLVRALEQDGIRDWTTVFVVSDHGFAKPSKLIRPNVLLRKAGLLRPAPRRRAQAVSEGGTAFVYLTEPKTTTEDRAKVLEILRGFEGIDRIVEPAQYPKLQLPDPSRNRQMGDLLLVAKEGYAFSDEYLDDDPIAPLPSSFGSHGYWPAIRA